MTTKNLNIEYCNTRECKYEDSDGFCTFVYKNEEKNFRYPEDAICTIELIDIYYNPIGLVPAKLYKKLKAKDEYGFR